MDAAHRCSSSFGVAYMTASEIDDAVLAAVDVHWRKVAMVIARAAEGLQLGLPNADEGYRTIARRIEALVSAGRLTSQGDIAKWRHSEIRLP